MSQLLLNNATLARLWKVYDSALHDTVLHRVYTAVDDAYGPASAHPDFTDGESYGCLYRPDPTSPELSGEGQVFYLEGLMNLPRSLHGTIDRRDRLRLTHLHGVALTDPVNFEIIGGPTLGQVGHRVKIRLVLDD